MLGMDPVQWIFLQTKFFSYHSPTLSSFITAGTADTDNKSEDNSVLLCYSLTAALIHMILVTMQAFTLTILAVLHFLTIQYYVHNFCKQAPTLTIDALY